MSILMTSSSKKARAGKKKAKASHTVSRVPCLAKGSRPPFSDETTSVWFWVLDGNPTTVTYNKAKNEVRCNGFILDAYDGFVEGEDDADLEPDDDDDFDAGTVIDFAIFVAESQTSHEGRLIRLPPSASSGLRTHDLYVDGFLVPEHTHGGAPNEGPYDASVLANDRDVCLVGGSRGFEYAAGTGQFGYEGEPPAYEFSMQGDGAQTEPSW